MRHLIILAFFFLISIFCNAQIQLSVNLVRDSVLKQSEYLDFSISNDRSVSFKFHYNHFSNVGNSNANLFGHHAPVDNGSYRIDITFKSDKSQTLVDSLIVDSSIARVEMFILLSSDDSIGDYIKEVKCLYFMKNNENITFSIIDTPKIGSRSAFRIQNKSEKLLVGYPNFGFFFGTLYENIKDDSWHQHYPLSLDYKYCDTISSQKILYKGQQVTAWAPNEKDCSEYIFVKGGDYFFQLLYSEAELIHGKKVGFTFLKRINIYRQIFRFTI